MITPWVWDEAVTKGKAMGASDAAHLEKSAKDFTRIRLTAREKRMAQELKKETGIGDGEAEVLAVASRCKALAILDDKDGRIVAVGPGVTHIGTAGVLYEAFLNKHLGYKELISLLEQLGRAAWISPDLLAGIIRRAREVKEKCKE